MANLLAENGVTSTVIEVCGLQDRPELVAQIVNVYNAMQRKE